MTPSPNGFSCGCRLAVRCANFFVSCTFAYILQTSTFYLFCGVGGFFSSTAGRALLCECNTREKVRAFRFVTREKYSYRAIELPGSSAISIQLWTRGDYREGYPWLPRKVDRAANGKDVLL